ncbi:MAG: 1,4-alpha-glucan branching enzyme, partial [Chloroflexota bacterium]
MDENSLAAHSDDIDAIIGGYHGDPFSVLGPHLFGKDCYIRGFLPQAAQASAVDRHSGESYPMTRLHEAGIFEAVVAGAGKSTDYRLKLTLHNGQEILYEDPYAFPSTISDYDEYLLAEGTHHRLYKVLGAHQDEVNGVKGVRFA